MSRTTRESRHKRWLALAVVPPVQHRAPTRCPCPLVPTRIDSSGGTSVYFVCSCGWRQQRTFVGDIPGARGALRAERELRLGERQIRRVHEVPETGKRCGARSLTQRPSANGRTLYRSCPVCGFSESFSLAPRAGGLPGFTAPSKRWPERPQVGAKPSASFEWDNCANCGKPVEPGKRHRPKVTNGR